MKVRHKGHLQIVGFQLRDASVKNSGLGATHNTRSEIDKIGTIGDHDGGRRTGTVRIGHRRAGAEEYHLRARWAFLWCLALRLLWVGVDHQQHQKR